MPNLLFIAIMILAFWLLVIRPQQVRQRKHAEMVQELAPGDEIVTIGGLYATVVAVGDRIRVRVADGSELEIAPMAVGRVVPADETADEDAEETAEGRALESGEPEPFGKTVDEDTVTVGRDTNATVKE